MSVLLPLTLLYAAILVLVLAGGLIAIVYFLNGARANLAKIAAALAAVNQNVEPLSQALTAVNDGLAMALAHLWTVQQKLSAVEATLRRERRAG
jgi:hypothetical protein